MLIRILAVGQIKEDYIQEGIRYYSDRLNKQWRVEVEEVQEERTPENPSLAEVDIGLRKETDRIVRRLKRGNSIILLDVEGEMLTTTHLKKKLQSLTDSGRIPLDLIIGGSCGVCKELLPANVFRLSFSKMTFPHQLMRLILLEQLDRVMHQ